MTTLPIALALISAACLLAQQPASLVSPELLPDHRAALHMRAPKAAEVTLTADWIPAGTTEKLIKDDAGVWSVTVGPLEPGIYIYSFNVDGTAMADPVNPRIKLRARTSASLLEIPADPPALWQPRDVPHGAVEINWEKSKALPSTLPAGSETRPVWIYTPPGYEKGSGRYPVLYLLHGSNDTAAGWTMVGGANFILDNLIAEKQAAPMIVAMPFGHALPFGAGRGPRSNDQVFEEYLLQDVIPLVEAKYRVVPGRASRAIAGLSMGGGQSLSIGFGHLDLFSAIGAFSAAVPADFETRYADALKHSAETNAKLKVLWLGCGKQDSLFPRSQKLADLFEAHQIRHTFRAIDGFHTYAVWRKFLAEMAPLLFR
jgi:enterochelin esterase-like enzyme